MIRLLRLLLSPKTLLGIGIGYGLAYFLDPDRGEERRAQAKDQLAARTRHATDTVAGQASTVADEAREKVRDLTSSEESGSGRDEPVAG